MIGKTEILKLNFTLNGSPWCKVTSRNINANGLQYHLNGCPWWGHSGDVAPVITGNIKRILKVDWVNVKTANKAIGH